MEKLFTEILNMSISASYLIAAVIIVRLILRNAPKNMRIFLWLLVGIRLVLMMGYKGFLKPRMRRRHFL